MGAYYEATIEKTRYCTHSSGNGLKLMEHSYVGNTYVDSVMYLLLGNTKTLRWVSDYTEDLKGYTWNDTEENYSLNGSKRMVGEYYVINHTKGVFIKIPELSGDFVIHPVPILCNGATHRMGGGDYDEETALRGTWCGDVLEVMYQLDSLEGYKDVTEELKFYE